MKDSCPGNIKKTLMRHAENVYWRKKAKKHDTEGLEEGVVVRTNQSHAEKEKVNHRWTARPWVTSGAWTQKGFAMNLAGSIKCK